MMIATVSRLIVFLSSFVAANVLNQKDGCANMITMPWFLSTVRSRMSAILLESRAQRWSWHHYRERILNRLALISIQTILVISTKCRRCSRLKTWSSTSFYWAYVYYLGGEKRLSREKNLSLIKLKRGVKQYRFRGRLLTVSPPSSNPDVIRPIIPGDEAEKAPSKCHKGDVARDESQRRFLTQRKVATLLK